MKRIYDSVFGCLLCLIITITCTLSSCNNSGHNSDDQYFISFRADLTRIVFTDQVALTASFSESGNQHICTISGGDIRSNISIQLFDDSTFSAGTYSGYLLEGGAYYGALMSYQDDNGIVFNQDGGNYDATIVVTELSATSMRGMFQGSVSALGSTTSITEGEFFVRRTN